MRINMKNAGVSPLTTIITDASWCPNTQAGGWAAWAVNSGNRQKFSGELRRYTNSFEAECAAITNGFFLAHKRGLLVRQGRVIIQSDCQQALEVLIEQGRTSNPAVSKMLAQLAEYHNLYKYDIEARHVRGHQNPNKDARTYVNNWCDREAKAKMRLMRKRLAGKCFQPREGELRNAD